MMKIRREVKAVNSLWTPTRILQVCVWQFGLEPKVGGLTMQAAQPSPTPGAFNPRMNSCSDIRLTG